MQRPRGGSEDLGKRFKPTLYTLDIPLSDRLANIFMKPFLPTRSATPDPIQAEKAEAIIKWTSKFILPTLIPALQSLGKALEDDSTNDDVIPPHGDDDLDLDMQSMVSSSSA